MKAFQTIPDESPEGNQRISPIALIPTPEGSMNIAAPIQIGHAHLRGVASDMLHATGIAIMIAS